MRTVYHSLIYPYLTYGMLLWGCSHSTYLRRLNILQKKAIKSVSKLNYNAHTEPLFKKLQILKLKDICTFQLSKNNVFIHSYLFTRSPNDDVHSKQTYSFTQNKMPSSATYTIQKNYIFIRHLFAQHLKCGTNCRNQ